MPALPVQRVGVAHVHSCSFPKDIGMESDTRLSKGVMHGQRKL